MGLKDLVANFYELWGATYLGNFSILMYDNNLYLPIAIISIIICIVLSITYYYIIDRPATAKISVWLITIIVAAIINFIVAFVSSNNDITEIYAGIGEDIPSSFTSDMMILSFVNSIWTIVLMFLLSLLLKWKSTNSSYIPF